MGRIDFLYTVRRDALGCFLFAAFAGSGSLLGHGLLHFLAALGAGFGALLALLVENLLGVDQLNDGLFATIALAEASARDAEIAAVAIAVTRRHGVKEARHRFVGLQIGVRLAPGMKIALLAQGDELLHVGPRSFGLRDGGDDAIFQKNGRDEIAQQRAAMARVPAEFESSIAMTHVDLQGTEHRAQSSVDSRHDSNRYFRI